MRYLTAVAAIGLLLAVAGTAGAVTVDTSYTIGTGTTQWVTTTAAVGSSSLELYWPKPGSNYAGVRITDLGDPTVSNFAGWSYWANAPQSYIPTFTISLDTALDNYAGRDYDTNIVIWPSNSGLGDTWIEFQSSSSLPYTIWWQGGGPVMKSMTWEQFQQPFTQWGNSFDFGDAVIKQIRISNNGIGTNNTITAYVDNFTLNGTVYPLEAAPIPEPVTLAGLVLGVGSLVGYVRRRRG